MEIKELVGKKKFDAVDFSSESIKNWGDTFEDCQVCRFRLDGVVYVAVEDPEDGYRSSMKELSVDENADMKNVFTPIDVVCRHRERLDTHEASDMLEVIDVVTGKVILEVGTENSNDYYPWFEARFHPEAMCLNS